VNKKQKQRLTACIEVLKEIEEEERGKRENAPEGLYYSENYERMEECADALEEAADNLEVWTE